MLSNNRCDLKRDRRSEGREEERGEAFLRCWLHSQMTKPAGDSQLSGYAPLHQDALSKVDLHNPLEWILSIIHTKFQSKYLNQSRLNSCWQDTSCQPKCQCPDRHTWQLGNYNPSEPKPPSRSKRPSPINASLVLSFDKLECSGSRKFSREFKFWWNWHWGGFNFGGVSQWVGEIYN